MQPPKKKPKYQLEIGIIKPITPKRILRPVPVKEARPLRPVPVKGAGLARPVPVPAPTAKELLNAAERVHALDHDGLLDMRQRVRSLQKAQRTAEGKSRVNLIMEEMALKEELKEALISVKRKTARWEGGGSRRKWILLEADVMARNVDDKRIIASAPPNLRHKIDEFQSLHQKLKELRDKEARGKLTAPEMTKQNALEEQFIDAYLDLKGPIERETELMREYHERGKKLEEKYKKK